MMGVCQSHIFDGFSYEGNFGCSLIALPLSVNVGLEESNERDVLVIGLDCDF